MSVVARGLDFLADQRRADGAVCEPLADPLGFLGNPSPSPREVLIASRGADVWCSATALRVTRLAGGDLPDTPAFLTGLAAPGQGLSWWTRRTGLCVETSGAAALADAGLATLLRPVLRRHMLPGGRWATFLLDRHGGYEEYMVGPSVIAWAGLALPPRDLRRVAASRALTALRGPDGTWTGHAAFYQSCWYPTHLALRLAGGDAETAARALQTQRADGGWAFDQHDDTALLPTAWALQCLPRGGSAATAALGRLVASQLRDGGWPDTDLPPTLYYVGRVYITACVLEALLHHGHDAKSC